MASNALVLGDSFLGWQANTQTDRHASCVRFGDGPIVFWQRHTIVFRLAFIKVLAGINMLCSDKTGTLTQNFMTIESKLPCCETSEQRLLSFALLASEWTQYEKNVIDTMLF